MGQLQYSPHIRTRCATHWHRRLNRVTITPPQRNKEPSLRLSPPQTMYIARTATSTISFPFLSTHARRPGEIMPVCTYVFYLFPLCPPGLIRNTDAANAHARSVSPIRRYGHGCSHGTDKRVASPFMIVLMPIRIILPSYVHPPPPYRLSLGSEISPLLTSPRHATRNASDSDTTERLRGSTPNGGLELALWLASFILRARIYAVDGWVHG